MTASKLPTVSHLQVPAASQRTSLHPPQPTSRRILKVLNATRLMVMALDDTLKVKHGVSVGRDTLPARSTVPMKIKNVVNFVVTPSLDYVPSLGHFQEVLEIAYVLGWYSSRRSLTMHQSVMVACEHRCLAEMLIPRTQLLKRFLVFVKRTFAVGLTLMLGKPVMIN
jgi:hypothetical protein